MEQLSLCVKVRFVRFFSTLTLSLLISPCLCMQEYFASDDVCSEDGILAVVEQDERPLELLAKACAINSFDIDPQNPSGVVCTLEWESIGVLTCGREAMPEE